MGHAGTLTEGIGIPKRLNDVEGLDWDLLGSKGLEGGGCAPGISRAVIRDGGNVEMKVVLFFFFGGAVRFGPRQDRSKTGQGEAR